MSNVIFYTTDDGATKIELRLDNGSVWLSQSEIAELLQTTKQNVSKHILAIYDDNELEEKATVNYQLTVQNEGNREVSRNIVLYNLDVILAVGYRVRSVRGVQFRQYASTVLKEYLEKGFVLNDERLKNLGGGNYWKELLERIRDIRSSEKVLYRQVLDLYATSVDYDPKSPESINFFKVVQNKLHYAVNKQTAAEIIYSRADAEKDFMGLTSFSGKIPVKSETKIAKNYLDKDEIFRLNRMVSAFFDLAEIKAQEHTQMHMKDWVDELDQFTKIYGKGTLENAGAISHEKAMEKAEKEYKKYQVKTLSPVEKDYLDAIIALEQKLINKGGKA